MDTRKATTLAGWAWVVGATVLGPVAYSALRNQFWFIGLMVASCGMCMMLFDMSRTNKTGQSNSFTRLSSAVFWAAIALWILPAMRWIPGPWPFVEGDLANYYAIIMFYVSMLLQRMGATPITSPTDSPAGTSDSN